ncbi:hypothetical protein [Pseudoalteromonas rubra]|uniref:hypothetical protein n=1 Tax=Pseudoalteromonas rubra TaxID=43658 RepID=UPI002DBE0629|nr:hypothetical protein [Pseudoalteromonas rubra]MEC4091629.1 hypothetical protein [Pseudoalteromonas rubra]
MDKAIFSKLPPKKIEWTHRADKKVHRHSAPSFERPMVNVQLARTMDRILAKWNVSISPAIRELRRNGGSILRRVYNDGRKKYKQLLPRRLTVRLEREQTINCLLRAIFYTTEYSPNAKFMFECMASVPELARMIGQYNEYEKNYDAEGAENYRHGRVAYDAVLGAIEDLEASGLLLIVREFCKEAGQFKAMRIFLTPKLFQEFGLTGSQVKHLVAGKVLGDKKQQKKFRRQRPVTDKMASIENNRLLSLLNFNRRWYNGEMDPEHLRTKSAEKLARERAQREAETPVSDIERRYRLLEQSLPRYQVIQAENLVKAEHPGIDRIEFIELVTHRLTN